MLGLILGEIFVFDMRGGVGGCGVGGVSRGRFEFCRVEEERGEGMGRRRSEVIKG